MMKMFWWVPILVSFCKWWLKHIFLVIDSLIPTQDSVLDGVLKQAYKMFKVREKCAYWEREGWTNVFVLGEEREEDVDQESYQQLSPIAIQVTAEGYYVWITFFGI